MYRTQVSPHRHGFLVERQYDSNDRGAWVTVDRYFTTVLDQPRKEYKPWMGTIHMLLNQHSAELPPIEIPIAPPIAYNVHERLERAEAEIEARNAKDAADKAFVEGCMRRTAEENFDPVEYNESGSYERMSGSQSVFEQLEKTVTEVSDRQPK